jgi:hypothetical protein
MTAGTVTALPVPPRVSALPIGGTCAPTFLRPRNQRYVSRAGVFYMAPATAEALTIAEVVWDERGILVIDGPCGTGKSIAVDTILHVAATDWGAAAVRLSLRPHRTEKAVTVAVAEALGVPIGGSQYEIERRVLARLAARPTVIAIDEAQEMSMYALEDQRHLWESDTSDLMLIVCGAGADAVVNKYPALNSRRGGTAHFPLLSGPDLPTTLRATFPMFTTATNDELHELDDVAIFGDWRKWRELVPWLTQFGAGWSMPHGIAAASKVTGIDEVTLNARLAAHRRQK